MHRALHAPPVCLPTCMRRCSAQCMGAPPPPPPRHVGAAAAAAAPEYSRELQEAIEPFVYEWVAAQRGSVRWGGQGIDSRQSKRPSGLVPIPHGALPPHLPTPHTQHAARSTALA